MSQLFQIAVILSLVVEVFTSLRLSQKNKQTLSGTDLWNLILILSEARNQKIKRCLSNFLFPLTGV